MASRPAWALAFAVQIAVVACDRDAPPVAAGSPQFDQTTMVTPAVARLLDETGHVPTQQASDPGAISPREAQALATAYLRVFGPTARTWLEQLHGRPLDFAALRPEGAVILAESPFEAMAPSVDPPDRKRAGPYYVVTLHASYGPAVTVAVSALASDITVDAAGVHSTASVRGNDFRVWPVPRAGSAAPALSAEQAIAGAFRTFGEPIDALPVFERKGLEYFPQEGAWRVVLAHPVQVRLRATGDVRETLVLYVTDASTFSVPIDGPANVGRIASFQSMSGATLPLRYRPGAAQALGEVRPVSSR